MRSMAGYPWSPHTGSTAGPNQMDGTVGSWGGLSGENSPSLISGLGNSSLPTSMAFYIALV